MNFDFSERPILTAILIQLSATLIVVGMLALVAHPINQLFVACAQGLIAAGLSLKLRSAMWWHLIHLCFVPMLLIANGLDINTNWYLGGFLVLLMLFWRTDTSRVPLYLSSKQTALKLAKIIPPHDASRNPPRPFITESPAANSVDLTLQASTCEFVDLGCGTGGLLLAISRLRPDCNFTGIEHAPIPWLVASLRCWGQANCHVRYGNFWKLPLGQFQLVYAFLSPAVMLRLWTKVEEELNDGSWLVSNSFAVPEISETQVLTVNDRRKTQLYCYKR